MRHLADSVTALAGKRIVVLGDVMMDLFIYGACVRISPEAPIPVVLVEREDAMLGGAGNVARNIAALGGEAVLIGMVGADAAADDLRARIAAEPGITADLLVDARPTTRKIRYVVGQQQMLRADVERVLPADPAPLLAAVERALADADALVLSDYAKGVLTPALLRAVIDRARALGKPVIADPKSSNVARYDGVTVLTPNAAEAKLATGLPCGDDDEAAAVATALLAHMPDSEAVLVTRGPRGMTLGRRDRPLQHLSTVAREVFDVSGAGDTVVASVALALAAGLDLSVATELGNIAAGIAVSKAGTAVVTAHELVLAVNAGDIDPSRRKVLSLEDGVEVVGRWRRNNEAIGFTNGCFDLLHPGHVAQLAQAKATCDRLVVGLNTDASVRRLKGPERPVQDQDARATVLAALEAVDLVILFDDETPLRLIEAIRPDVLIKGKDYRIEQVVGADLVLGYGGRVVLADMVPGQSTTGIIARLR